MKFLETFLNDRAALAQNCGFRVTAREVAPSSVQLVKYYLFPVDFHLPRPCFHVPLAAYGRSLPAFCSSLRVGTIIVIAFIMEIVITIVIIIITKVLCLCVCVSFIPANITFYSVCHTGVGTPD